MNINFRHPEIGFLRITEYARAHPRVSPRILDQQQSSYLFDTQYDSILGTLSLPNNNPCLKT